MVVSVSMPDAIAVQLHLDGEQGNRRALEMVALEGYRAGELSRGQVSELLELEFNETEAFLKKHGCLQGLSFAEYEEDLRRLREFLGR
jgi:predicted HTH domain antitoxin